MEGFLRRNPILRPKRARNIDSRRVNGTTTSVIKSWFQLLFISTINPENRRNMDESGIKEGFGANGLVVGSSERRSIQKNSLDLEHGCYLLSVSLLPVILSLHWLF